MTIAKCFITCLAALSLCACDDDCDGAFAVDSELKGRIIAHRGVWYPDVARQNSVQSLTAAAEAGYYGAEADVWQTADGCLVLNHDYDYGGTAIVASNYVEIGKGSLPLLDDALVALRPYKDFRLFIEVKSADPLEIAAATEDYTNVEFLSFDLALCEELIKQTSRPVYLLVQEALAEPIYLSTAGFAGTSVAAALLIKEPEYVNQLKRYGLKSIVWTVDNSAAAYYFESIGVDYITADVSNR